MSTPNLEPQTLDQKHHFLLRRLHSLSGIVPIGVFLIEHMITNSRAFEWWGLWSGGKEPFNDAVHFLHALPFLPLLEIFGIFLPLAFHAIYGLKIALSGESNVTSYPYMDNRRYFLQRLTGYIAFLFIIVHLLKFRFAHIIGWGPEFMDPALPDKFEITRNGLQAWNIWGLIVPAWLTFTMYWIGLAAACFHFANGIWTFCITWGITIGEQAQRRMGKLCVVIGLALFILGGASLVAFARAEAPKDQDDAAETVIVSGTHEGHQNDTTTGH